MSANTITNNTPFRPVRQWKPTKRSDSDKPRKRKDFTDANSNPETGVSFNIPFAFKNVGPKRVFAIFRNPKITVCNGDGDVASYNNTSLGFIERIDLKYRRDGNKCVFVHFAAGRWNDNEVTSEILDYLKSGMWMKITIDEDGHFWKTIISKSQRPADYFEDEIPAEAVSNGANAPKSIDTEEADDEQYLNIM